MGRYNKMFVKKLYLPNGKIKGQLGKMSRVTATSDEVNVLDGATSTNDTTAKAAILDSGGILNIAGVMTATGGFVGDISGAAAAQENETNGGTAGTGVTAVEYGDGVRHLTKLTFGATTLLTDPGGAGNNSEGVLIYTFPATGDIIVHNSTGALGLMAVANAADVPVLGIGSVIGAGATAVLNGTATFMDYFTETAPTAADGVADAVLTSLNTSGADIILTKGAHKLHFNAAATWTAADATMYPTGVFYIEWSIRVY